MLTAPQIPAESEFRFRARLFTRWSDEDMQGVLNNAVYLSLCEEARYRYFDELGLVGGDRHFPFVLLQSNVRFLAPGRGPAEVEVALRTTHLGGKSFQQAYRIRPAEGEEVWAEAEAVLVCWDPVRRGSAPVPEELREAVAHFEGIPARGDGN